MHVRMSVTASSIKTLNIMFRPASPSLCRMLAQGSGNLVQPLIRALATSAAAASNSVAIAGGMFGGSTRISTPLNEPLAGVSVPLKSSLPSAPAKVESSVLAEGVKLSSVATASPATTIALIVSGGSSLETSASAGASKVIERLAFNATKERTTFRMTRELEKIGVGYARAGRDSISFAIDTVKLHTPEAVELLLDAVLNAKLMYHEFRDNAEIVKEALAKLGPAGVLVDAMHRVAYDGPLGQPLLSDPKMSVDQLREHYAVMLKPSSMLLAGIGADHAELKALADPLFAAAHLSKGGSGSTASKYLGGSANFIADSPATHVALAFEAKGGLSNAKASALAAVSKALLADSRSVPYAVDAGALTLSSFLYSYKDTGLVGVTGASAPGQAGQLVDAAYKKVASVASKVSEAQLNAAKQVAIGEHKASLASTSTALPLMASSLMATGKFEAAAFAASVATVTAGEVSAYVAELAKSAPTLVTYGALASLPRYDSLAKRLA